MKCLTQQEIGKWLAERQVTPSPYGRVKSPAHYRQFRVPQRPLVNFAFIRQFLKLTDCEVLVHLTDWPTYEPAEMAVVTAIRHEWNESRNLIDASGHLFQSSQSELAIALFGLSGNFEWNAYLYLPNNLATLHNWEGELYDFWSDDVTIDLGVEKLIGRFELAMKIAE